MDRRLRVLISAYACEPGQGSEPGTSWEWCRRLAQHHDVTVLTRTNNQAGIERVLPTLAREQPVPRFLYQDASATVRRLKRGALGVAWYYALWQHAATRSIADLLRREQFELLHHLSFASFRFPAAVWDHGLPSVWGPVGGVETCPRQLLPWRYPAAFGAELTRNLLNQLQSSRWSPLAGRVRRSSVVVVTTPQMQAVVARLGGTARLLPTIAVIPPAAPRVPLATGQPLRLLFVGRLVYWKGVELALQALHQSHTTASLTLVGGGSFLRAAQVLARRLKLADRVQFLGKRPYAEAVQAYSAYDALLYPSLHDTGANVVLEAMSWGMPVICLDYGGPGLFVGPGCGLKIPVGDRATVIAQLAEAIRTYDRDRKLLATHGAAGRALILEQHVWDRRIDCLNRIYQDAVSRPATG